MFKAMIALTRAEGQTAEGFVDWWTVQHAPLARQLPGLRKAVFNVVTESSEPDAPDGIAELWFDTRADFEAAYATDIGKAVAQDSLDNVSARVRYLIDEHSIVE
jgi:uncharacterized protein (TIGR02118 family)